MKRTKIFFLTLAFLLLKTGAYADQPSSAAQAQMAEIMKYSVPGPNHKNLEPLVGKWNDTVTMWMDPKASPQVMRGTSENTLIMDGRFLEQKAVGEPQKDTNMPAFEGKGYTGYDNVKGQYTAFWLDNMGTGMMSATLSFDPKSKTFTETGTYTCPIAKKELPYRAKLTLLSKNSYRYEMFVNDQNGKEYKSMQIDYTRAK